MSDFKKTIIIGGLLFICGLSAVSSELIKISSLNKNSLLGAYKLNPFTQKMDYYETPSGSQTPWTSNIDAGGYSITDILNASTTNLTASGTIWLGTIGTGVWNGTEISATKGGTGLTSFSAGSLLYASTANNWAALATSSEIGYVLKIGQNGFPEWDEDMGSAFTAGDYLTLTSNDFDLDSEVVTKAFQFVVSTSSMATTTAFKSFQLPVAFTITRIGGFCNSGTSSIALDERAETTPKTAGTDVFNGGKLAIGDYVSTTTFSNASMAANGWVNMDIDGFFSGTPTNCYVNVEGTVND